MKILHIGPGYYPVLGGSEYHLQQLSEGLAHRGHEVSVLTANARTCWDIGLRGTGDLPEVEFINGVQVLRFQPDGGLLGQGLDRWIQLRGGYRSLSLLFGHEGLEMLTRSPRLFTAILHILRSDADIVTSMNWHWPPAFHTYLARKLKRFTLVGIPLFHTATPWCQSEVYRPMLAQCDAVITNTQYEADFVKARAAIRVEVAGVGIHAQTFLNRNGSEIRARYRLGDRPVVGFVGRQDANKGAVQLIEAMKTVWKWNHEVRLVLAGSRRKEPNDVDAVLDGLTKPERERIVRINEFSEVDKASIYEAFDVFALPSTEESFGIAYLEAWICEKPVIGSRIGPTQCVIDEGIDGLLVIPNDADDLAKKIIDLLSDKKKRESMGRSGHDKTISQFTWNKVTDKVENLYLELIATKGASQQEEVQEFGRRDRDGLAESQGRGSRGGSEPEASGAFKGLF